MNKKSRNIDSNLKVFLERKIVQAKIRDLKWREKNNIVWFFVQNYVRRLKPEQIKNLYMQYYQKDGTPKRQPPIRSSRWSRLMDRIHS